MTIKDIALQLGMSHTTVSRALNGTATLLPLHDSVSAKWRSSSAMSPIIPHASFGGAEVLISSSELTIGGLRAINQAELSIPDEISIAGYGDPIWFQLLKPGLTAISLPVSARADAVVEWLLTLIRGEAKTSTRKYQRIEPELIIRGSTSCFHE